MNTIPPLPDDLRASDDVVGIGEVYQRGFRDGVCALTADIATLLLEHADDLRDEAVTTLRELAGRASSLERDQQLGEQRRGRHRQ